MLTKTQKKVIENIAKCGRVGESCAAAGCHRRSHANWLLDNEEYKEDFEYAKDLYVESLEKVVDDRARKGSDILLMFLTKAHAPSKYRDNASVQLTGADGGNLKVQVEFVGVPKPNES